MENIDEWIAGANDCKNYGVPKDGMKKDYYDGYAERYAFEQQASEMTKGD